MKQAAEITSSPTASSNSHLPEGWAEVQLDDHVYIAGRIGWRGLKAEEYKPSGPILLSVPNLNHGDHVDFTEVNHVSQTRFDESPEIQLRHGDTLLVKDGAGIGKLGYVAELPGRATVNSSLLVVRPYSALLYHEYLFYYLKGPQFQDIANQRITGSTTPHLFQKDIKLFRVLVPPVAEQKRIVSQINELLRNVTASREHLAEVPKILKVFRQSVLAAACSGRLTEDWRESQPQEPPASEFLKRVEKAPGPTRHLPTAADRDDESSTHALPGAWTRCDLHRLFSVETGATPLRKNDDYYRNGTIPWVKTGEVQNCEIWEAEEFITPLAIKETNAKIFPGGTILIAMYGEGKTRGQVGRLRLGAATNQACAALVNPSLPSATTDYAYYYCLSQYGRLRQKAFGGNQPNLSLGVIKAWQINLPPLSEQKEIVRRVEALFKIADSIESRVRAATVWADRLSQSILAKAFRGELVPTEAELARREGRDYESASTLLERIKAERGIAAARGNAKRRSATAGK